MSTYTSEPGIRLAGRYRLEDQVDAGGGWALWKAIDEILARAVTVLVFTETFPRVREAVTAARAASRLNDSRLSQVFDVDDSGDRAFIVMEWVAGESLTDMLSDGPLDPSWAATLVSEAAQAISAAHAAGLAHLRLVPGSLRWTSGGGVKITGLGMDAAIAGVGTEEGSAEDRALTDTRQLAWLMYAAVTGYWPGPEPTPLPPAPTVDGAPCGPRQVSAGVPASIDSIICQALFQRHGRNGSVITTPIEFADALTRVAPRALPTPSPYDDMARMSRGSEAARTARYGSQQPPRPEAPGRVRQGPPEWRAPRGGAGGRPARRGAAKTLISLVLVLVLAAVAAVAWSVFHTKHGTTARGASGGHSASASPAAATTILQPVSANAADNPSAGGRRDRRQHHYQLEFPVLHRQPGLRRPAQGQRPDPGHGQAGPAQRGAGPVRLDLLRSGAHRYRQFQRPVIGKRVHDGSERQPRSGHHEIQCDQLGKGAVRDDLVHQPAADGRKPEPV